MSTTAAPVPPADHQAWQDKRRAELTAPDGWLSLAGLFWLEPGSQTVGSAADNQLVLPVGPAHWGTLTVGDTLAWQPRQGPGKTLQADSTDETAVVREGDVSFILIARDGQMALRLRDNQQPARLNFQDIPSFDFDPAWQLSARWDATPQTLAVATMSGGLETRQLPGRVLFEHHGQTHSLTPLDADDKGLFFVFADQTSGKKDGNGTYGAGRFLWAGHPVNGQLLLDFNRAYNPPCAFTPFATCPLAPPENRLPFAVTAGEKYVPAHS